MNKKKIKVGEIWISEEGTEAKIVKIESEEVWCESDFTRSIYPVDIEIFLKTMKRKK